MKKQLRLTLLCAITGVICTSCGNNEEEHQSEISQTQQAVINGEKDDGDLYVVGLYHPTKKVENDNGTYSFWGNVFCTGTLVHPQWVLTAAHCVTNSTDDGATPSDYNNDLMILIGQKAGGTVYYTAGKDQIYWPSDYTDCIEHGRDIALIKLKNPMSKTKASPVLPHPKWLAIDRSDTPIKMDVVGYGCDETGTYEVKRKATYTITDYCGPQNSNDSTAGCNEGLFHIKGCHPDPEMCNSYGNYDRYVNVTTNYSTFFQATPDDGIMTCNGDSGGPSFLTIGGTKYVAAITSWGDTPIKTYAAKTAVQDYYDWIISIAPEIGYQYKEKCDNGIDDDGNGLVDDDDPACYFCGNGIVNIGEQCDGNAFSGNQINCTDWSIFFSSGTVGCDPNCQINTDNCKLAKSCGDDELNDLEECDGDKFPNNVKTCEDYDKIYSSGNLKCTSDCKIDFSACKAEARCGDGKVNGEEQCDGNRFLDDRYACKTVFPDLYQSGAIKCSSECKYDTSACVPWCGNGQLNKVVGEVCDGSKFGGKTCETLIGPGSTGTLKCVNGCTAIDTSDCSKPAECGDNKIDAGEDCDGTLIQDNKTNCSDWDKSYTKGTVSCNSNCTINYSLCEKGPICGNGSLESGEQCDGTKFSGNRTSCKTLFPELYSDGTVKCSDKCEYDISGCIPWCGNGAVNTKSGDIILNEKCDHSASADKFPTSANTCEKVVGKGSTGTLICSNDCKEIIVTGCSEPAYCGDGIVNNTEQCDGNEFKDNQKACTDWDSKYISGEVSCTSRCGLDFSACELAPICGDKKVNGTEDCDGTEFKIDSVMCSAHDNKYVSGRVTCSTDCKLDVSACKEEVIIPDEICTGGIDEDGDNKIDCEDPDCVSDEACKSKHVCGDGIVNGNEDCDGTAFFADETQCSEWMRVFKNGTVTCNADCTINYDACSTTIPEICDNKIDDNGNGRIDCDDPECINFAACIADTDPETEDCGNEKDDDGNGKTDCEDPACEMLPACNPEKTEICGNKLDDDGNGKADCDDEACKPHATCQPAVAEICDNNKDDDGNGKTDCEDPACTNYPSCKKSDNDTPTEPETPTEKHICENEIDDNGDGKIDCDDKNICSDYEKCQNTQSQDEPNDNKESGCSATPSRRPQSLMPLFMLFGAGLLLRRRKSAK